MTHDGPSSEPQTLVPATNGRDFSSLPGIGILPYVAGLLDGEGCIGIQRSSERRAPSYSVRLDVGMTVKAKPLLDGLRGHLGGQVRRTRAGTEKWAEAWCWALHGKAAAELLATLLPWIQLKREQAVLALAFQSEVDRWREESQRQNAPWPEWLREVGRRAWERNRELNAKGPAVAMSPQPVAYLVDGRWTSPLASMFGEQDAVSIPKSGCTQGGVMLPLPMSEASELGCSWLPTPTAADSRNGRNATSGRKEGSQHHAGTTLCDVFHPLLRTPQAQVTEPKPGIKMEGRTPADPQVGLIDQISALLPTPVAKETGRSPEAFMAMRDNFDPSERMYLPGRKWHAQRTLSRVATMLPTPTSRDHKGRNQRDDETCLPGAVGNLLPTPTTQPATGNGHARNLGREAKMLPTPTAWEQGNDSRWDERVAEMKAKGYNGNGAGMPLDVAVSKMLPTPSAADGMGGHHNRSGDRKDEMLLGGIGKMLTLPTPTARLGDESGRGADPERYKGSKSLNGRRSNLDDMVAATEAGRWSGEPTEPPSPATSDSSDDRPLTLWTDEAG